METKTVAVEPDVDELIRRGREMLLRFDPEGYEEAVPLFRAAIEASPASAAAYAGLAETYAYWGFRRAVGGQESQSLYAMAYDYADMALRLAPTLAAAHRAMAVALRRGRRRGDTDRRREEIEAAVELDPEDCEALSELWRVNGYCLDDGALARALALNPRLVSLHIDLGAVYCEAGRYEESVAELRSALRINPRNSLAYYDLAMVLDRQGRKDKAELILTKALELRPGEPLLLGGLETLRRKDDA